MRNLRYVVVGTGRCGTVAMARLLTSLGIVCGHECCFDWRGLDYAKLKMQGLIPMETSNISKDGLDQWLDEEKIVAESSYMAAPFINNACFRDTKFIHVVRNPVDVVSSFSRDFEYFQNRHPALWMPTKDYETFIYYHCPELFLDMTQDERTCRYVTLWNQMIENKLENRQHIRHRIEDPIDKVLDFIGVSVPKNVFNDKKINSRRTSKPRFFVNELRDSHIKQEFKDLIVRYGYMERMFKIL